MAELTESAKKSILKAVSEGTEGLDYGYDRIYKRAEIVREQARKHALAPHQVEDILAEFRQARPEPLPTEPDVPITGPPPNPVPAPQPGTKEPDENFDSHSGTVEAPAHRVAPAKKAPAKAAAKKEEPKKEEPAKKASAPAAKKAPAKKTSAARK